MQCDQGFEVHGKQTATITCNVTAEERRLADDAYGYCTRATECTFCREALSAHYSKEDTEICEQQGDPESAEHRWPYGPSWLHSLAHAGKAFS